MNGIAINHIGAFGIVYNKNNPSTVFLEVKDDGHPIERVRRKLCCIGGNWIDTVAQRDKNPRATFVREFNEELSFDRPLHTIAELVMLGLVSRQPFHAEPKPLANVGVSDRAMLDSVKNAVASLAVPFGDFINTAAPGVLGTDSLENSDRNFSWLSSYYVAALEQQGWDQLMLLQQKFNNLSNESLTLVISLPDMLQHNIVAAFGHDYALREFFISQGFKEAKNLPLIEGLQGKSVGAPLASYGEYVKRYAVAKHPALDL